jgi:hypothetical protein
MVSSIQKFIGERFDPQPMAGRREWADDQNFVAVRHLAAKGGEQDKQSPQQFLKNAVGVPIIR